MPSSVARSCNSQLPFTTQTAQDVVALGEEQLDDQLAMGAQALGVRAYHHALFDLRQAGRLQFPLAFDFDQAQPAGADVGEPAHVGTSGGYESRFPMPR